ncbi:hypothetical protein Ahy_A01g001120 isoform I [Arachis hypogaea]|uniref:Fe2OG dioxygenase domain-containing protein n=1 Tax=Arachis hypogaea TaxID=3818 RepID=A0A445EM45_ARAHY|nr:hypothetical protein Ahy_A01g001120 isoform I [Arachis hypogaea]
MIDIYYYLVAKSSRYVLSLSSSISKLFMKPKEAFTKVSAYTEEVREVACEILELIAEGLGVPDTSLFSKLIKDSESDSLLRLNHYPPLPIPPIHHCTTDWDNSSNKVVGFGEHSDPQILTILRSNDVPGLQISLQDGLWVPVIPDPSAFFVNVGDVLENLRS